MRNFLRRKVACTDLTLILLTLALSFVCHRLVGAVVVLLGILIYMRTMKNRRQNSAQNSAQNSGNQVLVLKRVWKVSEWYLKSAWKVSEKCLKSVWKVFTKCLKSVWKVDEKYLKSVWKAPVWDCWFNSLSFRVEVLFESVFLCFVLLFREVLFHRYRHYKRVRAHERCLTSTELLSEQIERRKKKTSQFPSSVLLPSR